MRAKAGPTERSRASSREKTDDVSGEKTPRPSEKARQETQSCKTIY